MNKSTFGAGLLVALIPAWAQDIGRVISSTPVEQPVQTVRQVCSVPPSGNASAGQAQQCGNQTFTENRTVAWNVIYEHQGRAYSVQMPYNPGATVRLQLDNAPAGPGTVYASPVGNLPAGQAANPAEPVIVTTTSNFSQTDLGQALAASTAPGTQEALNQPGFGGVVPAEEQITYGTQPFGVWPYYTQAVWPYAGYVNGYYGAAVAAPYYGFPYGLGLGVALGAWGAWGGYGGYGGYYRPGYRPGYGYPGRPGYGPPGRPGYGHPGRPGYGGGPGHGVRPVPHAGQGYRGNGGGQSYRGNGGGAYRGGGGGGGGGGGNRGGGGGRGR